MNNPGLDIIRQDAADPELVRIYAESDVVDTELARLYVVSDAIDPELDRLYREAAVIINLATHTCERGT